jgi:hypothetical protein
MTVSARLLLAVSLISTTATVASAQFGGGSLHGTSVGLSYNTATGDFKDKVQSGFGFALHTGLGEGTETWSGRGSFGFDRFNGTGALNNVQFISYGFDIVHTSSPHLYQFVGIGLSSTSYDYKSTADAGAAGTRNGQNFGFNGGIGVNLGTPGGIQFYTEFAATTLFTGSKNSNWLPVRIGLKF